MVATWWPTVKLDGSGYRVVASREMTCIVGIETPRGVLLGADSMSAETTCWTADVCVEPKVFRAGAYVMGFTTSFRMGDLLRHQARLEPPSGRGSLHRHLVTKVIPALRELFKGGGFATSKDGAESGGCFLLGRAGKAL
jgi:hypothetical protein